MTTAKTQFSLIAGPLLLLIMIKVSQGSWKDIFTVADWSLASVVIFCQSFHILLPAIIELAKKGGAVNPNVLLWHLTLMVMLGLLPSFYLYIKITTLPVGDYPSIGYQAAQVVMFIFACIKYFWDFRVVNLLHKK
ncbi:hypothetical protein ACPV5G_18520 [Photobacterium damselae]|uniref:hypothetical protein n=1 Tax=Photobacterium damselae TaxID=38293 RepID=UPI004068D105